VAEAQVKASDSQFQANWEAARLARACSTSSSPAVIDNKETVEFLLPFKSSVYGIALLEQPGTSGSNEFVISFNDKDGVALTSTITFIGSVVH